MRQKQKNYQVQPKIRTASKQQASTTRQCVLIVHTFQLQLKLQEMDPSLRKVTALKFKGTKAPSQPQPPSNSKQELAPVTQLGQDTMQLPAQSQPQQPERTKTLAEKSFQLVKKTRLIQKANEKSRLTNKDRLEKLSKVLSKMPDHYDLAKIGDKIQKGY